jgi:hypothetical protein
MKKFVVLCLVGLLILAFGATGYAQQLYELDKGKMVSPLYTMQPGNYSEVVVGEKPPVLEFKASGMIDVIYEINKNVPQVAPSPWSDWSGGTLLGVNRIFAPQSGLGPIAAGPLQGAPSGAAYNTKQSYWETRARLRFDALMGKQVSGTIFFEIDAARWGERNGMGAQRNQAGDWNADAAAVEVKNAFITFALPPIIPVPVTVNAGILPWVTRPTVNYTDGTGINVTFKPDPVQIKFTWMKALENQDWASDDADVYGLEAKVNLGTLTAGGFVAYYNMNTYPFQGTGALNMYGLVTPVGGNTAYGSNYIINNTANMGWWGLFADGKVGPVNICFDFDYDYGSVTAHGQTSLTNPLGSERKVDYRGFLGRLGVDFPWEKFNFGFVGMYASGSDMQQTSSTGLPGTAVAYGNTSMFGYSRTVKGYIVPPNSEHVWDDESLVIYGTGANGINRANTGFNNGGAAGGTVGRGAYGGTWFAKLYANFKPTPWYRITLFGMYIGDTTKHGNTIGNAVTEAGYPRDDKSIGWEVDLINDIQIYKNLQLRFGAGYLFAGKAFDYRDQRVGAGAPFFTPATSRDNVSPSNPWAIATKLIFVF